METLNIENVGLSKTELSPKNMNNIPIERLYYICLCNKQIVIHKIQKKYYLYTMNWIPKIYIGKIEMKWNSWIRLGGSERLDIAISIFRKYCYELTGEFFEKDKLKLDLTKVIDYLIELNNITKGVNNEL